MLNKTRHEHIDAIECFEISGDTMLSADLLDGLEAAVDRAEAAAGVLLLRVTGGEAWRATAPQRRCRFLPDCRHCGSTTLRRRDR
jgi:hypothetical protein